MDAEKTKEKYERAKSERQKHVDAILSSPSAKKIVVAGAGTGKTYLFREVLKGKQKTLTLTFVNALVEDLSLELCGLSDVKTLHSFARSELGRALGGEVKVFPKLSEVIRQDAKTLLNKEIDFDHIFHNRDDGNEGIEFYGKRKEYYDKHYGYSDIIFAIVKYFEANKEKVPVYEQVVVDEFQDFNKLEVSLIDLLSEKSPVLLAGDDDQALYAFKSASADHIRHRHGNASPEYASFNLPYCSRCTRVIVEAANDIIRSAIKNGNLKGRISKPYEYFEDEGKNKESEANPNILYKQAYAAQIPWLIEQRLGEIAELEKNKFSVLIISPTKTQVRTLVNALKGKGFENIEAVEKRNEKEPTIMDGFKILLNDEKSNLGWRIILKLLMPKADFETVLKETEKDGARAMFESVGAKHKKEVSGILKVLRAIKNDKKIDQKKLDEALRKIGFNPHEISKDFIKDEIFFSSQRSGNAGLRKVLIKATTIPGSKGLAADYVFITHFDDLYFIKDENKKKISDQDICNFLVALTRAGKGVYLISSDSKKEPAFLKWIQGVRLARR